MDEETNTHYAILLYLDGEPWDQYMQTGPSQNYMKLRGKKRICLGKFLHVETPEDETRYRTEPWKLQQVYLFAEPRNIAEYVNPMCMILVVDAVGVPVPARQIDERAGVAAEALTGPGWATIAAWRGVRNGK